MRYDQLDIRRRRFAGILLAVYLPLLAVLMLHTHGTVSATAPAARETVTTATAAAVASGTHPTDCPLCTFLHTTYLPPAAPAVEAAPVRPLPEVIFPYHFVVLPAALPHRSPRAPPVIGLV